MALLLRTVITLTLLILANKSALSEQLMAQHVSVGGSQSATYLKIDLKAFDIKVLSAIQFKNGAATGYSLEDYSNLEHALAVLSGGYIAAFAPPTPLGFVKSNGVVLNAPHETWVVEGVLCTKKGQLIIRTWSSGADENFPDCLQAGPILLLGGKEPNDLPSRETNGYQKLAKSIQAQTFVCTMGDQEVLAGVTDKINLPTLVSFLRDKLRCMDAIRLTGQATAGLRLGSSLWGSDAYLFPDAIAVVPHS